MSLSSYNSTSSKSSKSSKTNTTNNRCLSEDEDDSSTESNFQEFFITTTSRRKLNRQQSSESESSGDSDSNHRPCKTTDITTEQATTTEQTQANDDESSQDESASNNLPGGHAIQSTPGTNTSDSDSPQVTEFNKDSSHRATDQTTFKAHRPKTNGDDSLEQPPNQHQDNPPEQPDTSTFQNFIRDFITTTNQQWQRPP